MKNTLKVLGVTLFVSSVLSCTMGPPKEERHPAAAIEAGNYDLTSLTEKEILALSSSENLGIGELKILTDNTDSLESKIDIIKKAKSEIILMYYIYSVDESSSYLTRELLRAAERNVKVRILVDFFVNYKNYDYFRMLEEKSRGNIQVSFYGVPQGVLLESMSYLVSSCEEQNKSCVEKKWSAIKQAHSSGQIPFFTKLLVAGLYSKTPDAVKIALSEGSQLDLKGGDKLSPDDKAQLMEFLQLVFKAKVKGDVGAKLKLAMALAFYGDQTLPIYEKLLAVFPLVGGDKNLARYWENSTDFVHHKLIMADGRYMQLGGRNIEDSYHMAVSPSGKYTFLDTDVYAEVKDGDDIEKSYDKMWNFSDSVKPLKSLDPIVAHNFTIKENLPSLVAAIQKCQSMKATPNYGSCIEKSAQPVVTIGQRVQAAEAKMLSLAATYDAKKIVNKNPTALVLNDPIPFVTYLENLSYTKKSNKRLFGSGGDKNISEMWIQAIKNTCKEALATKQPQQITLLNAYVFMPAALYSTIGDALSGRIKCPNVIITIATNSIESTDLKPVNMFASYQFLSLAKAVEKSSKATIRILEMKKVPQKTTYSLHTKASIFGDDLIIGSANADIRSYHMDSNNAFFIRRVPQLTAQYKQWVSDFIEPSKGKFVDKTAYYKSLTFAQAQAINMQIFNEVLTHYGKKIEEPTKAKIRGLFSDIGTDVYRDSQFFLSPELKDMSDRQRREILKPRTDAFDSKYQIF